MRKFTDKINESVPTELKAENILSEYNPVFYEDMPNSTGTAYTKEDVIDAMIKFAKLHVEKALKAAHSNMQLPDEDMDYTSGSYPNDNIK